MSPSQSEVEAFRCDAAIAAAADKPRRMRRPIGETNPIVKPEDDGNDSTTGELLERELREYHAPVEEKRAEVLDIMAGHQTEIKPL